MSVRVDHLRPSLPKTPSGIDGLDQITGGGLPHGRPTLVCGSAGCGKTLLAMEFLVRGAQQHNDPGVMLTFEEQPQDLAANVASLGFDLAALERDGKLVIDHVRVRKDEIEETGEFDLEGLFVRLGYAIDRIGAKRVVIDTIEALFSGFTNEGALRAELVRLFHWLKERAVTAVITAERGTGTLTRHGLEEYVSDCVLLLDHRVRDQVSTRRLRIVKYRGSNHGTNEYPFLIDADGICLLPITQLSLDHPATSERISSGVATLDAMLDGAGFFRASSILITGTAGTGKSSLAAHFVDAACRRGERCCYFSFEESPDQILRNMRSIGLELEPWRSQGLLKIDSTRPTTFGLEMHLSRILRVIQQCRPQVAVFDPITAFISGGDVDDATLALLRLIDFFKAQDITVLCASLTPGGAALESSHTRVSSLMDSWVLVRDLERNGERRRSLAVLKSRGMKHSNKVRELLITDHGVELHPSKDFALAGEDGHA